VLRHDGCDAVQGFLFCPPVSLTRLREILSSGLEVPMQEVATARA